MAPKSKCGPRAGRPGCKAFISGKKKQNTIKTTTFSDRRGRTFSAVLSGPAGCTTKLRSVPRVSPSSSTGTRM